MKKILALVALAALMIASLGTSGFASMANAYADVPEAMPAQPVE